MSDTRRLKAATGRFFDMHWPDGLGARPTWWCWNLQGDFESRKQGGCYAVFKGDQLLYVGLALSPGSRASRDDPVVGLYARLRRHVVGLAKGSAGDHYCKSARLTGMTHVEVIAFPNRHRYLAAALEAFLVQELQPPKNYPFSRLSVAA